MTLRCHYCREPMHWRDRVWSCKCGLQIGDGRKDVSEAEAKSVMEALRG